MSKITVIGAGLMGHGIALVFARHGHEVTVQDPDENALASLHERVQQSLLDLQAVSYTHLTLPTKA